LQREATFRIRTGTMQDIDALMEIRNAVRENRLSDPRAVSRADYQAHIAAGDLFVCEEDARILGFSAGTRGTGWIWALFVRPEQEGRGIGRALLDAACAALRAAGHHQLTLSTDPDARAAAFYRRAGWRDSGHATNGDVILTLPSTADEGPESAGESGKNLPG
jgi:ribosomal protein S18 acetylase RimI-like enzyme